MPDSDDDEIEVGRNVLRQLQDRDVDPVGYMARVNRAKPTPRQLELAAMRWRAYVKLFGERRLTRWKVGKLQLPPITEGWKDEE